MAGFNVSLKLSGTCPEVDGTEWNDQIEDFIDHQILKRLNPAVAGPPGEPAPWWYGCTDDSKHRAAQKAYAYERQQAGVRDIAAKERVRLYEIVYQARKAKAKYAAGYKAPYDDGVTYVAFDPASDANRGEEIPSSVEEYLVTITK